MVTDLERFHNKYVVSENGCWEWTACKNRSGYGRFRYNSKWNSAHIFSHITFNTNDPLTEVKPIVLHSCHNPSCCNPEHLRAGSHQENMDDMMEAGRNNPVFGEGVYQSKLIEKEVIQIRQRYITGLYTQKELGEMYNVTANAIWSIIRRKSWSHLP